MLKISAMFVESTIELGHSKLNSLQNYLCFCIANQNGSYCLHAVLEDILYAQNNCICLGYSFVCAEEFLINHVVILF